MKQKAILALASIVLLATFTAVAYASYGLAEGVDGYVYGDGMPAEGITVHVYNSLDQLEGYGVEPGDVQGQLGTDITDASGYFHIAWLQGEGNTYKVVAETPVGDIVLYVIVWCGQTTRFNFYFEYCNGEPGYTPGFWKHNIGVALGYNPGNYSAFNDGTKLTAAMLQGYADSIPVSLEDAYAALTAKGPGANVIRDAMANAFNEAAGYGPFED